jgi:Flp pilus assembly pilin Flp
VLQLVVHAHLLALTGAERLRARATDERGQTSAEYALVLFGAAAVAMLVTAWAGQTDRITKLLDTIFDSITRTIRNG